MEDVFDLLSANTEFGELRKPGKLGKKPEWKIWVFGFNCKVQLNDCIRNATAVCNPRQIQSKTKPENFFLSEK